MMRAVISVSLPFLAVLLLSGVAGAQTRGRTEVAQALDATMEVERALLAEDVQRYIDLKPERQELLQNLRELYNSMDNALQSASGASVSEIEEVMVQILELENQRSRLLDDQERILERVAERLRKIDLLNERINSVRDRAQEEAGALAGEWRVTLMPVNQGGMFHLEQTGTVINGTYRLQGGWTGSLQGTLVSRKVYLVRIDSKLGRSMEFEGVLSADGNTIRGTWINYDLAAEGGSQGQWSATRSEGPR